MTTPITGQGLNVYIPPDDELSLTSTKAAQNKVITEEITNQQNAIDANEESIADTQSMIATVEATTTASKNYAVGDLLVYDGKLYKVTSAIATGATIIVGSNVTQATVDGVISDIQDNVDALEARANGYVLIESIDVAEDVANVIRATAPNGKAYALRKIAVILSLPEAQSITFRCDVAFKETSAYVLAQTPASIGSSKMFFLSCEQDGALIYTYANAFDPNRGINMTTAYGSPRYVQTNGYFNWATQYDGQPFNRAAISILGKQIPAGSNIKIYGVWA